MLARIEGMGGEAAAMTAGLANEAEVAALIKVFERIGPWMPPAASRPHAKC